MPPTFFPAEARTIATEILAAPVIFLVLLGVGRVLKRRYGVHLGIVYKLFAFVFAVYLPSVVWPDPVFWRPELRTHLGAASLIFGTFCLLALIRRFFWEGWFVRTQRMPAPKFVSQLFGLLVFIIALLFVVGGIYGQSIQGAVFGSTVVLGIVGFAMQDLLGNIIAGVALELGKPFRTGDWLVVDGQHAEVMEVNWRSTRLRTNDDVHLDIPNKSIVGATIVNLTYPTRQHGLRIAVGFDAAVPPNLIKDLLARAAAEVKGVLAHPAPKVFLKDFAESAITYEIRFWLEDESLFNEIHDGIRTNIWYAAQRANIKIPFPIRTVQIERLAPKSPATLAIAQHSVKKHPFFALLDEDQMARLLERGRAQRFGRGEKVIVQGGEGYSMFVLLHGEADVFVESGGHPAHVTTLRSGDYCGEMSLLTGEPRSATVIARADCELWEIDKATLGELLQGNDALVQQLGEILAQRRMMTEGVVASGTSSEEVGAMQQEYARGFLTKLSAFFDL